jgi:hypothetical protein
LFEKAPDLRQQYLKTLLLEANPFMPRYACTR